MKIVLSGGSGLIGSLIGQTLANSGHDVAILTRSIKPNQPFRQIEWDPQRNLIDDVKMEGTQCIINLAGAPVAQRWTTSNKENILESRINSTKVLVDYIDRNKAVCHSFISASAIGLYPSGDSFYNENSASGNNFLSEVVQHWENAAFKAETYGCRVVALRIGIVLAKNGGALDKLLPIFKLGLGSPVGSGKQWQSWIHINDLVQMFQLLSENFQYAGIYNAVAPNPVTNKEFSSALAKSLNRPFWLPAVPAFVLKLVFGKMSQIILNSQKVSSKKIEALGFKFKFPTIDIAFENLFRSND
jgi:uncharacterized protein